MRTIKPILLFLMLSCGAGGIYGQPFSYRGMAAGQLTAGYSNYLAGQVGVRYIPELRFTIPAGGNLTFDGELSANLVTSYTGPAEGDNFYGRIKPYRAWAKLSGDRFEIRGGLQKINFGSATILRPLMWFDRIDPRDPLQLTDGVYGLLGRYYTLNNLNFWGWVLYGNSGTRGWEILETAGRVPEFGSRIQLPAPATEIAFTFHQRRVENPATITPQGPVEAEFFTERRGAFDIRTNLLIGLWLEIVAENNNSSFLPAWTSKITAGADYTFGIGNGVNLLAEHFTYSAGDELLHTTRLASFSAATLSYPLTISSRVSAILYYDWTNSELYRFLNIGLTYDRFSYYLMGFWNPDSFRIFDTDRGPSLFNGKGLQFMIVFNH